MRTILSTPAIPCLTPPGVFDAFGWCASDRLEWQGGGELSRTPRVTADNPPRMIFIMKQALPFLPRELACLHLPGLGLTDEWALAPYGIDDATDGLHEHRVPPREAFWLATDSVAGLFWGLHDWAHFHNHGPFVDRAWTELQCDASALTWLWSNQVTLGLSSEEWDALRRDVLAIGASRFAEEGTAPPEDMSALVEVARATVD